MGKQKRPGRFRKFRTWHYVVYAIIAGLLAYGINSQFGHFRRGLTALADANLYLVSLGVALTAVTFFLAAGIYRVLAMHHLKYWRTLGVEIAAAFVTRLLPAGLGSLGLHGDYLHRQKHNLAEATAVVSINNAIGILGNIILLIIVLALWPHKFDMPKLGLSTRELTAIVIGVVVVLIILISVRRIRRALTSFIRNFGASLRQYARHPQKLLMALGLAMILTLTYALILSVGLNSVGVKLAFSSVFVVFSIGTLVGSITPTPGGLVGVEAGLFAGLAAYGVASAPALAAVLLFRLLTYWLPLIPGLVAFIVTRHSKLI